MIIGLDGKPLSSKQKYRARASGFSNSAASITKPVFKGWDWSGGSPDDDIVANLSIIRQRSRQLTMEAPIIAGLYKTLTTNVVGDGLRPEPTPDVDYLNMSPEDARKWKADTLRFWKIFAESIDCDAYRRDNFYELTRLILRSQLESGDCFVTLPSFSRTNGIFDLKVQVIESDCVCDPLDGAGTEYIDLGNDIYGGVELSEYGEVLAYWFYTGHPLAHRKTYRSNSYDRSRWTRIPAFGEETGIQNVLHLMETVRPNQRRGIPLIAPVVELALTLDRYMKAEAIAAQIQAMFTLIITSENPESVAGEMGSIFGDTTGSDDDSFVELGPGIVQYARPGESVTPVNPSRPTTSFEPFINSVLQQAGPSLGMPYELLVQKFDSSYSASRAALNMASSNFKVVRSGLVKDFCQPVYDAFMDEAVARGYIDAPGYFENSITRKAYLKTMWNGPGIPQIDPVKEVRAYQMAIDAGLTSRSQASRLYNGSDYHQNIAELGLEREEAKRHGIIFED